jgi:hypothetical protein
MAWESRKGRGRYYTRSVRVGGRVVRRYLGTGAHAERAARLDAMTRAANAQERADLMERRMPVEWAAEQLEDLAAMTDTLVRATLVLAGYHQHHRGEWRKRRAHQGV